MNDLFQTRRAIIKAKKRKYLKQCLSFTFGLLGILLAGGAPASVIVQIDNYPGFTFQIALALACFLVAIRVWRE